MCTYLGQAYVCVAIFSLLSTAYSQERSKLESQLDVPGGQLLSYFQSDANGSKPFAICYSGSPEWLVSQKDAHSNWHKIASLESVEIRATTVTSDEIAYVASLKSVLSLTMEDDVFEGYALAPLEKMVQLKALSLDFSSQLSRLESKSHDLSLYRHPSGEFFQFFNKLESLESLFLWPQCDKDTYVRICKLRKLNALSLGRLSNIDDDSIALIRNLPDLQSLSLPSLPQSAPLLKGLRGHSHLKSLSFETDSLNGKDIEAISTLKGLESLTIRSKSVDSLSPLQELSKLKVLRLNFHRLNDSDNCQFLSGLPVLEELRLVRSEGADISIDHLRGHERLKVLRVSSALREEDIPILESMPELKIVSAGETMDSKWYESARRRLPHVTIEVLVRNSK